MLPWTQFAAAAPELAVAGEKLIYQFGIGLGYLATLRPDGAPRLHPFCPIRCGDGLYGLLLPESPKARDLHRDGRYSIHACNPQDRDDEFMLSGRAVLSEAMTAAVRAAFLTSEGAKSSDDEECFEFLIDRALLASYRPRAEGNTWPPKYTKWQLDRGTF